MLSNAESKSNYGQRKKINLAKKLAKARSASWLLLAHEAAIQLLRAEDSSSKVLLEEIKKLGRVPMRQDRATTDEEKKKTIQLRNWRGLAVMVGFFPSMKLKSNYYELTIYFPGTSLRK